MHKRIQICLLFLLPALAGAQSLSSKGRFSIAFDRGCAPMDVTITELDTFGVITRQYYFFEGANITNNTSFTYDNPGTYQIVQVLGQDDIEDRTDTLLVEVFESVRPEVLISSCSNLEVAVQSTDTYYDSIRVYFGGPDSVTLQLNESINYQFASTTTQTIGLKGFFDNANEICDSFFEETIPLQILATPTINSQSIKETCLGIYSLYMTLDTYDPSVNYRVILDQGSPATLFDGYLDSTRVVLYDIPFTITDYCLTIEAFDPCNNTTQTSNQLCSTPSSLSLSPFASLYSTYTDGSIYINLDDIQTGTFEVQRRFEGGTFEPRTTVTGSFNDPIGVASRKYFYQIDYRDSCDNVLYSAETHPPFVDAEQLADNQYQIVFTEGQNSLTAIDSSYYEVGSSAESTTGRINSIQFDLNLDAKEGTPRQYLSAFTSYDGGSYRLQSNTEILKYELIVYVPTAFTPNGDGVNDKLEFFGLPSSNASFNIYSRWGELIYSSENPLEGWDGLINGSVAPDGTYLYEIIFETVDGDKLRQKGTFAVINK